MKAATKRTTKTKAKASTTKPKTAIKPEAKTKAKSKSKSASVVKTETQKKPAKKMKRVKSVRPTVVRAKKENQFNWSLAGLYSAFKKALSSQTQTSKNNSLASLLWILPIGVITLAIGLLIQHQPKPSPKVAFTSARLSALFEQAQQQPMQDRIAFWSENIYKDPELLYPLGQGPEINDTAPLFPRGFDCTTFVETVGALAKSSDEKELAKNLIAIRYKNGQISYENRNHFPEADWIPNNESAGLLKDITVRISRNAGFVASYVYKEIDKTAWFRSQKNMESNRAVAKAPDSFGAIDVKVPYLPLDRVMGAVQHIPQGALINIVRESKARYPVLISHQGFLIWKNGVAYFRHASRNKEVTEVPLEKYVKQAQKMPWRVLGMNINAFSG